ncbi:DUF1566 domain-containing protein [Belliella sp. R4-6]|uniref:DUF1566 domain-containing protein n=1 Tax=Belliella alkalica TaxID=1730871 RepID=A0ABS9VFJ1_9BACT|nr:DUF1566 domain-containing protein [Belliella alkalica]MCH7414939.1 DUF1566 domain-containing protein [Belliella alkalica]
MNSIVKYVTIIMIALCFSCEEGNDFIQLGMEYQGGKVFYLDKSGKHGLIAAPEDFSVLAPWGCINRVAPGANFTHFGVGKNNTNVILEYCDGFNAARLCSELSVGGFEDWYLPSKDELEIMFQNRGHIGNMRNGVYEPYWSSSQYEPTLQAFILDFGNGLSFPQDKANLYWVRAIRSF